MAMNSILHISLFLDFVLLAVINISKGGTPCMTWIHRSNDQVSSCPMIDYYSSGDLPDIAGKYTTCSYALL